MPLLFRCFPVQYLCNRGDRGREAAILSSKIIDGKMDSLFEAILTLQSKEECYRFFEDLCTISELLAMEQRFSVAKMLREGRVYSDIVKDTGASTATISRVNRSYHYGSDGYAMVLDRLENKDHA